MGAIFIQTTTASVISKVPGAITQDISRDRVMGETLVLPLGKSKVKYGQFHIAHTPTG